MRRLLLGLFVFFGVVATNTNAAYAESTLSVQPLQYTETLQKGEKKRAFIDITNPSSQPVMVQFDVEAFKQIDERGTLTFYDDARFDEGILLDLNEKEIPANKTLRLFFIVDGAKLPMGDIFAAVFARTKPDEKAMTPSVRIGTLLILTNGTPSARKAEIVSFTTSLLHFGKSIDGQIRIKNTAPANTSSGFTPKVRVQLWPFGLDRTITGPLVFAGNTRTIKLDQPSNLFGVYKISASFGSSTKDRWVILVTGVWRWVVPAILAVAIAGFIIYKLYIKARQSKRR